MKARVHLWTCIRYDKKLKEAITIRRKNGEGLTFPVGIGYEGVTTHRHSEKNMGEIVAAVFAMIKDPAWITAFAVVIFLALWLWGDKVRRFFNRQDIKEPMKEVFWFVFFFVLCSFLTAAVIEGQRITKELETARAALADQKQVSSAPTP